ncbi:MAG TPA: adenylate/guanylate cyclase domain-containing protein [Solirubrobacteraceae bacterium]|nr:adenylate/guanylate cyclase domain-containing protein [Solirubrobacteraceae bacterium]
MRDDGRLTRLLERVSRLDSSPAALRLARTARELLPGDSGLGDALSTARGAPTDLAARRLAEVSRRPSAARELSLGVMQVYQALSEAQGRGRGERELAILFTDLVNFSDWALEAGDAAALDLLRRVGDTVERGITEYDGVVVKRLGDGHMAAFPDPAAAVEAACAAQSGLDGIEVAGYRPALRAGVHLGRPRKLGGDYLGVDVNIAARVADAASEGEVLVSAPVLERLDPDRFEARRRRRFRAKGTPKDLQVYSVRPRR